MKWITKLVLTSFTVVAIGATAAILWHLQRANASAFSYKTAEVRKGDVVATISATGTLEPEQVVDVGAQVAGQIKFFGPDLGENGKTIDYGSQVEEGSVLAQIDDALYKADVALVAAQLHQAKANLNSAEANVAQMQAKFSQSESDLARAKTLLTTSSLAPKDFDAYDAAYGACKANLVAANAAVDQARGGIEQAQAALDRAQKNLDYCTIKSPVKGVIVDRRVNIGQTVVSSLNAPSLFLIAKDLKRMQLWASVNEADVGNIHSGQPVTFMVDAFPNETFRGEVKQIRLNATMTQNVVTYTVEIVTDNAAGKLLPYLTANVMFEVSRRQSVLLVPNAALRWKPGNIEEAVPEARADFAKWVRRSEQRAGTETSHERAVLWVRSGSLLRPVEVQTGVTDGVVTEITGELAEGAQVVNGTARAGATSSGSASPFTPQMFRPRS